MNRITGLATGIDTDSIIQNMMKVERLKVDRVKQDQQYKRWQQEAYREMSNLLRAFQSDYFDVLNPSTNFRSPSMFAAFSSTVQVNGVDTSVVTATAGSGATAGTHTLKDITLAKNDIWESSVEVSQGMVGDVVNFSGLTEGKSFDITLDGVKKTITLDANYGDMNTLINGDGVGAKGLQQLVDEAFGLNPDASKKITISDNGSGGLKIDSMGHTVEITDSAELVVDDLGFTSGDNNIFDMNKSLKDVFGINGVSSIEINGKTFDFAETTTIGSVINQINNSDAGVTLSYSNLSNKFTLQSKEEGVANRISFSGELLTDTFKLTQNSQAANDATFTLDGITTTRSTNEFTVDGVSYVLNSDYAGEEIKIGVSANPDELIDKINGFVENYNKVIGAINERTIEKRYRDYTPLTEEQKKDMSEKDIELWEEKAKSGILRSDLTLEKITRDMRMALYSEVEGVDTRLYSIGITTSSDYHSKGKLIIDEEKLRAALEKNPNEVMELFTKSTNADGSSVEDSKKGLAHKLYDILQDNIRTTRNDQGQKGTLLEKAGIEGDASEFKNMLTEQIETYDKRIADLLDKLVDKENNYYSMFARMEKAISQMNAQSSWLMSQMGGGM